MDHTIVEPVEPKENLTPSATIAIAPELEASPEKSIGEQLDEIALIENINHDELLHRIGISRSRYYEVKAGRGGKKSKAKVRRYISGFKSDR